MRFYNHFFVRRDLEDAESLAPTVDFEMPPKQPGMQRESTVTFDPDTGRWTNNEPSCAPFYYQQHQLSLLVLL